jgi:hypothetical protein
MILGAHQTQYMPYSGLIDKIIRSDVFVFLDDLQYVKNDWHNRNRIRTPEGWSWLTIPVHAHLSDRICDVVPAERDWARRHRRTVELHYRRSKHRDRLEGFWEIATRLQREPLSVINYETTMEILRLLGIERRIVLASSLGLFADECATADQRLISLCRRFGCDRYLSGPGGRDYMDLGRWREAGVAVDWQDFAPESYPQLWPGWVPNLSTVDLLLAVERPRDYLDADRVAAPEAAVLSR